MAKVYYAEGMHIGEVIKQGLGESSTKGTPYFFLTVKVLGTPADESYVPHDRQYERTLYIYLTEKTAERAVGNLRQLGFEGSILSELDPSSPRFQDFAGNQVDLYCEHQEYNGSDQERWSIGYVSRAPTPLDPKKMRSLDAVFGKALRPSVPVKAAAKVTPKTPNTSSLDTGITDDDIPF